MANGSLLTTMVRVPSVHRRRTKRHPHDHRSPHRRTGRPLPVHRRRHHCHTNDSCAAVDPSGVGTAADNPSDWRAEKLGDGTMTLRRRRRRRHRLQLRYYSSRLGPAQFAAGSVSRRYMGRRERSRAGSGLGAG